MHVEFLLEEPSAEEALRLLLPRLLPSTTTYDLRNLQGKTNLLKQLRARLQGFANMKLPDLRVVVLVDRDDSNCEDLKRQLEEAALAVGLPTKSSARGGTFVVLNRIAIEELEAWFFGDVEAIVAAYPKVPPTLGTQAKYRDPDDIAGGTAEALERVLQSKGYHPGGLAKLKAARDIAQHMDPARNRSRSFQAFITGLAALNPYPGPR
ncbi:MAG TPA: DUF4276 family protein [Geothrix sp.]